MAEYSREDAVTGALNTARGLPPRLLLATGNAGKLRELRHLLEGPGTVLLTPADLSLDGFDVEETGATFEANALLKARAFAEAAGLPALADDSGLEVDALDGFPGVRSARWAPGSDADRVLALLERMQQVSPEDRGARFRSVVALAWPGPDAQSVTASGTVEGRIAGSARGEAGFGYDPIFLVEDGGHDGSRTMAELSAEEKNRLSHRARAIGAIVELL